MFKVVGFNSLLEAPHDMVDYKPVPPDPKWDKKVSKLANEFNELARKLQGKVDKKTEVKIRELLLKIEDGIIRETNERVKKDFAVLIQLLNERHSSDDLFTPEVLVLLEHVLGHGTKNTSLDFKQPGNTMAGTQQASQSEQPAFDIQTIDLARIALINLEKISTDDLEKRDQKCAFGDGEILDDAGNVEGDVWRCKGCKTVYHENCLRVCLLMKGSCQICDVEFLRPTQK